MSFLHLKWGYISMQPNKTGETFPWIGFLALTAAGISVVLLLSGPIPASQILQTWKLSRASGIVAYLLLWASVSLGLLQSINRARSVSLSTASATVDLHCFLSAGALYATAFHAVILVWDRYLPFSWLDILLPWGSYQPLLVGLGSVAFYIGLAATISTYLRSQLSSQQWRSLHQFSLAGFVVALLHGWFLGTESSLVFVKLMYIETGISVTTLTAIRFLIVNKQSGVSSGTK